MLLQAQASKCKIRERYKPIKQKDFVESLLLLEWQLLFKVQRKSGTGTFPSLHSTAPTAQQDNPGRIMNLHTLAHTVHLPPVKLHSLT